MAYTEISVKNFFEKKGITTDLIRYILRRDDKTCFYLLDNRVVTTPIPMNHFQKFLPENSFTRINKTVIICNNQVVNVNRTTYLMTDGTCLEGRHHETQTHTSFFGNVVQETQQNTDMMLLKNKMTVINDMPLPFCIIQPMLDSNGTCTSFSFHYCNRMMSLMDNQQAEGYTEHSYYEVFKRIPNDAWLSTISDVSNNGSTRVLQFYNDRYEGFLFVACYRLEPGYCGCVFFPDGWANVLERLNKNMTESHEEINDL